MTAFLLRFLSTLLLVRLATAQTTLCPLLGPDFPPPRNVSQNSGFRNTTDGFSNTIQQLVKSNSFDSTNNTFSINVFSIFSDAPLFEYHYTAPLFSNGSVGTKTVDGNTLFRIGSISKLFTVFSLLIEKGDANFNDPVTKYVPELRNAPNTGVVNSVQWDDVTLGSLASQMSGIGRDFSGPSDLGWLGPEVVNDGLPPLNSSDLPSCGIAVPGVPTCDRASFFTGFLARHPVFAPSTTPIYSNIAFHILAYALENMVDNKTFDSIVSCDILKPLSMSNTRTSPPSNSSLVAIPGGVTGSGWDVDLGDETPAGGIYSTSNDLAKFGRAILNSTLLPPAQTRRWMKPVTHTSSLMSSVGAPWEIYRVNTPRGVVDLYTKSGGIGVYASLLVLAPDYDFGWVILSAGDVSRTAGSGLYKIADLIADAFIPAIEAAAKDEAVTVFAGTYRATNGLNSSITIVTDGFPGLAIQSWITNGTDALQVYLDFNGVSSPQHSLTIRLYPTNLLQTSPRQQAFRAVFEILPKPVVTKGVFSPCTSWGGVDAVLYGNVGIDEFLFQFDGYGRAVSIEPRFLRVTLQKDF